MSPRLLDWFLPARRPSGEEELFRHRFVAILTWLAAGVAVSIVGVAGSDGPSTALFSGLSGMAMVAVGVAMKLGLPVRWAFWIDAVIFALLCAVIPLGERKLDWALIAWVAAIPLAGALFDRARGGFIGFALALVSLTGALVASRTEVIPRYELPSFVPVLRIALFCLAIAVLAIAFERLRAGAAARAFEAARARTYFLAHMSHEIRTPMNGVIGLADLLLADAQPPETRRTLELIRRSGEQLVGIINDIVDFSRLDLGKVSVSPRPTQLREIVADCIELGRAVASRDLVTLRAEIAADVPEWLALDPVRVRQILLNLVGNAAKFTHRGEIVVRCARRGDTLTIAVADTGIGIPEDAVARLFQPFEQVASPTHRYGGSGLGLAITRHLVVLMGGAVALESAVGVGSTFTVSVPLREEAPPRVASAASSAPVPPSSEDLRPSLEVLVVDDNEVNRFVASAAVRRLGYEPVVAVDGLEAVRLVADRRFAFVLMDCYMPELDGFDATRRIRTLPAPASTTPVLALTAGVLAEERDRCRAAGMDAFIPKPLTIEDLRMALPEALARGAERRALFGSERRGPAVALDQLAGSR